MRKKILALILICLLLLATLSTLVGCNRREQLTFGSYPQTLVTDSATIGALNGAAGALPTTENGGAWTPYGYYIGGSTETD